MSDAVDLVDDFVYHAHIQERFKTAQAKKIKRYMRQLNKLIAEYLRKKRTLETRADYARASRWVKTQTDSFTEQLLKIIEKDLRHQFKAEREWLEKTLPDSDKTPSEDRVVNTILFGSFNGTDTIKSYVKSLSERIFKVWDGQMRIAVTSRTDMKWVIKQVLGE